MALLLLAPLVGSTGWTAHKWQHDLPVAIALDLRGGGSSGTNLSPPAAAPEGLDEAPPFRPLLEAHTERLGQFMEKVEASLTRARTTCKSGFIASLFGASKPANIVQRRDRGLMIEAFSLISELYGDTCAYASQEQWPECAAASVRLQCCLQLLVDSEAYKKLKPAFVAPETTHAFKALHEACRRKPEGTVASAVYALRPSLPLVHESAIDMVHAALLQLRSQPPSEGRQADDTQPRLEEALDELRHMHHVAEELEQKRKQAEEHAAALTRRVQEAEAHAARSSAAHEQHEKSSVQASEQATKAAVDAAVARIRAEAAEQLAAAEARSQSQLAQGESVHAQLRHERDAALQEMKQHRIGAATLQQHATALATTLSELEQKYASALSTQHSLEQYCARLSQLEQQVHQRMHALAQPVPREYATVSASAHRELQLELQQLSQRMALVQQQHAATLELLRQRQAEAASATAHARAMAQKLELEACQPSASSPAQKVTSRAFSAGLLSGIAEKLLDKSRGLKEQTLGFVADFSSTIQANKAANAQAAQAPHKPESDSTA
ncbi:hypothetical protein AB1Y20_021469 [Prymnesium parvum]|uniref:Uncharacterized protein n=1 Tax=Prymnesium parvum TaxID=97485 RepID=A0AB34JLA9_PRYPA